MGAEGPTDVLSFPLLPPDAFPHHEAGPSRPATEPAPAAFVPPPGRLHLGDIVVSVERAIEQAAAGRGGQTGDVRWSPAHELRLLVTHGALHISGWDHADPAEEAAMRALEAAAARRGLVAPDVSPVQLTEHTKPDPGGARPRAGVWSRRVAAYCFTYQSTAFQVGPAWVGLPTKLPAFALCRSTFWR